MKKLLLLLSIWGCMSFLFGQNNNINYYEYWFDEDYAGRVTSNVNPVATFDHIVGIPTSTLSDGLHTLHIRFKDSNSNYSSVTSQLFLKQAPSAGGNNEITAYEYWFDNDYAGKIAEAVSDGSRFNLMTSINTSSLNNGLHRLNIRFQDTDGRWCSVLSHTFYKGGLTLNMSNKITSCRYWFDGDISNLYTLSTNSLDNPLHLIRNINASHLSPGQHTIFIQFLDEIGQWNTPIIENFIKFGDPKVDNITPNVAGNIGQVTVTLNGMGFYSGSQVRLIKPGIDTITPILNSTFIFDGQRIQTTIDLKNKLTGNYNVEISIPNVSVISLIDGFTITEGLPVQLWSSIQGFEVIRLLLAIMAILMQQESPFG